MLLHLNLVCVSVHAVHFVFFIIIPSNHICTMITKPQAAPFTVTIIGGGLAGLALSIGLTRFGISHKIYESAKCFSEIGAGIAMGPNAVWALTSIDPRLRQCYSRCATYNEHEGQRAVFFDIRYGMESDKTGATKYAAIRTPGTHQAR